MNVWTERRAEPGELCTCGRQAVLVWPSEHRPGGVVGWCGLADGGAMVQGGYGKSTPCPHYQLRAPAQTGTAGPERPVDKINGSGRGVPGVEMVECRLCTHNFDPDGSPDLELCWQCAELADTEAFVRCVDPTNGHRRE